MHRRSRLYTYVVNRLIDMYCHGRGLWSLDLALHILNEVSGGYDPMYSILKAIVYRHPAIRRVLNL